jgi:hypothetical protein
MFQWVQEWHRYNQTQLTYKVVLDVLVVGIDTSRTKVPLVQLQPGRVRECILDLMILWTYIGIL